ncbi:sugar phosphate isomerase [Bryobacterales bacterium F-183]|nr:sugar phosphate isomerase [Bryobacterales bacterium F-183]
MNDAKRKMTIHLVPGSIGVQLNQREAIEVAKRYGFEAVAPDGDYLATLQPGEIDALTAEVRSKGLIWGNAGLSVDFRKDPQTFEAGLAKLPAVAKALQRAGVTRMGTWIGPSHASLTYLANFQQHTDRLRKITSVLGGHGIRLGLEYVGPKTLWTSNRYPFIHTMAECKELIAAVGREHCGLLLDSWHWYTAGETVADIEALKKEDIICGDLNDAPAGVPVAEQIDSKRELPMATGVIPVGDFLNALQKIGFDGPIRCEPFNAALRAMPKELALDAVSKSMHKAFALIR